MSDSINKNLQSSVGIDQDANKLVFQKGDILFREGDPGGSLYFINTGSIEIFQTHKGKDVVFDTLHHGEMIGTLSLLTQEPRLAGARATTETQVTLIPAAHIKTSVEQFPIWMRTVIKDFIIRIKHVNESYLKMKVRNEYLSKKSSNQKEIAFSFIQLIDLIWEGKSHTNFNLTPMIPKFSTVLGCSTDDLNQTIQTLIDVGLLEKTVDKITIHSKAVSNLKEYVYIYRHFLAHTKARIDHGQLKNVIAFLRKSATFKLNTAKKHQLKISDLKVSPISAKGQQEISIKQLEEISDTNMYGLTFDAKLEQISFVPNTTSVRILAVLAMDRFEKKSSAQEAALVNFSEQPLKTDHSTDNHFDQRKVS